MSPNDNRVSDKESSDALKDRNFGGNRKITDNIQKDEDYTKPTNERRSGVSGDAEEEFIQPSATDDIDDLNDPNARKREASRRAETSTVGAQNKYRRGGDSDIIDSDPDNRPESEHREDDVVKEPDPQKKHGTRNPWHFGESYKRRGDQNVAPNQQSN
jgi:hypothetical protein